MDYPREPRKIKIPRVTGTQPTSQPPVAHIHCRLCFEFIQSLLLLPLERRDPYTQLSVVLAALQSATYSVSRPARESNDGKRDSQQCDSVSGWNSADKESQLLLAAS